MLIFLVIFFVKIIEKAGKDIYEIWIDLEILRSKSQKVLLWIIISAICVKHEHNSLDLFLCIMQKRAISAHVHLQLEYNRKHYFLEFLNTVMMKWKKLFKILLKFVF